MVTACAALPGHSRGCIVLLPCCPSIAISPDALHSFSAMLDKAQLAPCHQGSHRLGLVSSAVQCTLVARLPGWPSLIIDHRHKVLHSAPQAAHGDSRPKTKRGASSITTTTSTGLGTQLTATNYKSTWPGVLQDFLARTRSSVLPRMVVVMTCRLGRSVDTILGQCQSQDGRLECI